MSTTAVTPAAPAASMDFEMPAPGSPGYLEFRKTGKLPSAQETEQEESATSTEPEHAAEEMHAAEVQEEIEHPPSQEEVSATSTLESSVTRAASEAARPQKRLTAEERKAQLRDEIRALIKERDEIAARTAPSVTQASQPAEPAKSAIPEVKADGAKPEPQLDDKAADGKPKYEKYNDYLKDWHKWSSEEATRKALAAVTELSTKTQQESKAAEAERIVNEHWQKKLDAAREKYPDFDATVKNLATAKDRNGNDFIIPRGFAIDEFFLKSPFGADVLRHIAQHVQEPDVQRIFERTADGKHFLLSGTEQVIALTDIASQFKAKPASVPPARPVTKAPPPPHQVIGKTTTTKDEAERAVEDGDQEAFSRIENEKQLEKMRRGRRGK